MGSKLAERLYPQMLQTTVCCNAPMWFSMVMKVGKMFMSAKTFAKFKLFPRSGKIEDCPFATKYFNLDEVPSFLGGPCRCEHQGGCVAGLSNDCKTMRTLTKKEIEKLRSDTLRDRKEEVVAIKEFTEKYKQERALNSNNI